MGITDSYIVGSIVHNEEVIHRFHSQWVENTNEPRWEFHRRFRMNGIKAETPREVNVKKDSKKNATKENAKNEK